MVRDLQPGYLDRIVDRDVLQEFERDAMRDMVESAVTLTVSSNIRRVLLADWEGSGTPYFAAVLVTDVDHLSRRIAHGIVSPRVSFRFC